MTAPPTHCDQCGLPRHGDGMSLLGGVSQFFFHVRQDSTLFEDKRGGDFDDLRAAWIWALHDARAMIVEGTLQGPIEEHWIEIYDF